MTRPPHTFWEVSTRLPAAETQSRHPCTCAGHAGAGLCWNVAPKTPAHFDVVDVQWGFMKVDANATHISMEVRPIWSAFCSLPWRLQDTCAGGTPKSDGRSTSKATFKDTSRIPALLDFLHALCAHIDRLVTSSPRSISVVTPRCSGDRGL